MEYEGGLPKELMWLIISFHEGLEDVNSLQQNSYFSSSMWTIPHSWHFRIPYT